MCSSSVLRHSSDLLRPRRSRWRSARRRRRSAGAAAPQPAEEGDAEHAEQPDEAQEAERPQGRAAATPQGTRLI